MNNMENHFSLRLIIDTLNKQGWDCLGGMNIVTTQGVIGLHCRVLAYGIFSATGQNPSGKAYMRRDVSSPDDMWEQVLESIDALNDICQCVGLPQYLPMDRTEAHARILQLLGDRLRETPASEDAPAGAG